MYQLTAGEQLNLDRFCTLFNLNQVPGSQRQIGDRFTTFITDGLSRSAINSSYCRAIDWCVFRLAKELPGGTTVVEFDNGYGVNLFDDGADGWIEVVNPDDATIYEQSISILRKTWANEKDIVRAAVLGAIGSYCLQIWELPMGQGIGDDPSYHLRMSKFCTIENLFEMIGINKFVSADSDFQLRYTPRIVGEGLELTMLLDIDHVPGH